MSNTVCKSVKSLSGLPGGSQGHSSGGWVQPPLFDDAPDPAGSYWLGFTPDHPRDDAVQVFLRRHGQAPAYVVDGLNGLLVGPVPGLEGGAS